MIISLTYPRFFTSPFGALTVGWVTGRGSVYKNLPPAILGGSFWVIFVGSKLTWSDHHENWLVIQ